MPISPLGSAIVAADTSMSTIGRNDLGGILMVTGRNACRGKLILVLAVLVALAGFQTGLAEDQDFKQLLEDAVQGDACAQSTLGFIYANGKGVPENNREAGKWFRLAADQGNAEAQFNLGFMYANGEGVPKDYLQAYIWANLAAAQGGDWVVKPEERLEGRGSIKFKDWLRRKLTAEQVAEAQKLSVELFNRIESSAPELLTSDCSSMLSDRLPSTPLESAEPAWKGQQEIEEVLKESTTLPGPIDLNFVSKNVTPPTVLSRIEPVYSEKAREAKLQGKVVVSAIVRKDGSLEVLKVVRGLGLGLDKNAIDALKKWRFRPGMRDGKPVDVALNIEVNFKLTAPVDP